MAGFKFRVGLAAAADTTIIMGARHAGVAMEQEKNDSPAPSGTHYQIIKNELAVRDFAAWLPPLVDDECYYIELFCRRKYDQTMPQSKTYNLTRRIVTNPDSLVNSLRMMEVPLGAYNLRGVGVSQESLAVYISTNPRCRKKATFNLIKTLVDKVQNNAELRPHSAALTEIHRAKSRANFVTFDIDVDNPLIKANSEQFDQVIELVGREAVSLIKTRGGYHLLVEPKKVVSEIKNWHPRIVEITQPDQTGDILSPIPGCVQGGHTVQMVTSMGRQ